MQRVLLLDADRVDDPGSHHDSVCHLTAPEALTATNTILASYSSSCAVMLNIPGSFSPRSVTTFCLTNTRFFSCTSPPTLKIGVGGLIGMTKLPGAPDFFFMDSFNLRAGESKTIKLRDGLLIMSPSEATTSVFSVHRWSDTVNQPLHAMGNAVSAFMELTKPRNTTDVTFKNGSTGFSVN